MFSKPKYGWTEITLGDFKGRGSYTTDIPMDLLNAFINALKYSIPASVFFDEEGSEFTLVSHYDGTYIIVEREEKPKLISVDIRFFKLIKEIINDLESNIDEWTNWMCYYDSTEEELSERENLLKSKIEELKNLINQNKKGKE